MLLEAGVLLPHAANDSVQQVALVLLGFLIGGAGFVVLLSLIVRSGDRRMSRQEWLVLLVAGLMFRLTLLPLSPATSPDVHRYLWEGLVQQAGLSPYVHPPGAATLDPLAAVHPEHAANVRQPSVHPDLAAIYPPTAQALFLLNARCFDGALWGWKLILLCFDALLLGAMVVLLRQTGRSPRWAAAAWWCPLLLFEVYEAGHLDLIGVALLTAGIAMYRQGRKLPAGVLLGLSINVKYLWPGSVLVYLIAADWRQRRFWRTPVAAGVTVLLSWWPYRESLGGAGRTSRRFLEEWQFNDLIVEFLRLMPGPRWIPPLLAFAVLLVFVVALARSRRRDLATDTWRITGVGLLLSPVAYPWYFLWAVPGLAFGAPVWLVVWILLLPVLHVVDWQYAATGVWNPMPWLWAVVTVPPVALGVRFPRTNVEDLLRRPSRKQQDAGEPK
jgi:hypothetical protein